MASKPVVVCLGLSLGPDGSMAEMLIGRCKEAAKLSKERSLLIINCGGDPKKTGMTEAKVMTDYMVTHLGVDKNTVVKEEKSTSTCTNAIHTLGMFEGDSNFIGKTVLSSPFFLLIT